MVQRYRKMGDQLGRVIPDAGAHMPSAMVGVKGALRRRRTQKEGMSERLKGGSKVDPRREYDPRPMEFLPGSM